MHQRMLLLAGHNIDRKLRRSELSNGLIISHNVMLSIIHVSVFLIALQIKSKMKKTIKSLIIIL